MANEAMLATAESASRKTTLRDRRRKIRWWGAVLSMRVAALVRELRVRVTVTRPKRFRLDAESNCASNSAGTTGFAASPPAAS